jgi:hypothetical protein
LLSRPILLQLIPLPSVLKNRINQVAFFFHLHRAQLIAREGVSRSTKLDSNHSAEWRKANRVSTDEVEQYGCLAAETIYSVYISTDPVAYCEST